MNVVHFYASNLNGVAEGGIASYVRELLKYPSKQFKHRFVGVTRNHQHWVGTWCQLQIEKCLVDFFPALSVNKDYVTYDKGIPLNAKYLLALFLYRSRILKSADILHFHRVELALPFILFKQRHIPIVLTIHGSARHHELVRSHKLFSKPWFNWLYLRIETLILSRVDRVILVNSEGFNHYTSKFLGIKDKFVMVPTFVDCDEFKPMDKLTSRKNFGLDKKD
ncbi:MAG: glycosyltransferase [Candidatus Omnitrophica bacterium]|nr:glycosyltransferase [Candidatus Omnitrophota bacterium]